MPQTFFGIKYGFYKLFLDNVISTMPNNVIYNKSEICLPNFCIAYFLTLSLVIGHESFPPMLSWNFPQQINTHSNMVTIATWVLVNTGLPGDLSHPQLEWMFWGTIMMMSTLIVMFFLSNYFKKKRRGKTILWVKIEQKSCFLWTSINVHNSISSNSSFLCSKCR